MRPNEDPYLQHYYRINFDGSNLTPLTTANAYHDVSFSSDMTYYVDTYSRTDLPNIVELHRTSDGSLVKEVEHGDMSKLTAAGFKPPEVFVAKGRDGKTDIWGVIVRPRNFDPKRKYPVVENIYAIGTTGLSRQNFECVSADRARPGGSVHGVLKEIIQELVQEY